MRLITIGCLMAAWAFAQKKAESHFPAADAEKIADARLAAPAFITKMRHCSIGLRRPEIGESGSGHELHVGPHLMIGVSINFQGFNRDATNEMPYVAHLPNRTELICYAGPPMGTSSKSMITGDEFCLMQQSMIPDDIAKQL